MKDILLDEDGDLEIVNGDLQLGISDQQHKQSILAASKGEYKAAPALGVGLIDFVNDETPESMMREVRQQFAKDGMHVKTVRMTNGKLQVDANY